MSPALNARVMRMRSTPTALSEDVFLDDGRYRITTAENIARGRR
jgi:hypothetical protein